METMVDDEKREVGQLCRSLSLSHSLAAFSPAGLPVQAHRRRRVGVLRYPCRQPRWRAYGRRPTRRNRLEGLRTSVQRKGGGKTEEGRHRAIALGFPGRLRLPPRFGDGQAGVGSKPCQAARGAQGFEGRCLEGLAGSVKGSVLMDIFARSQCFPNVANALTAAPCSGPLFRLFNPMLLHIVPCFDNSLFVLTDTDNKRSLRALIRLHVRIHPPIYTLLIAACGGLCMYYLEYTTS